MMMYLIVFLVAGLTAAIVVAVMNKLAVMQEAELGRANCPNARKAERHPGWYGASGMHWS